jgi:hypothetical protein
MHYQARYTSTIFLMRELLTMYLYICRHQFKDEVRLTASKMYKM